MNDNNFKDKKEFPQSGENGDINSSGSMSKTPRTSLSTSQFKHVIGNFKCGTSNKVLSQNVKLFEAVKTIYKDWLNRSNGGKYPTGINQPQLIKKYPTLSKGTITRSLSIMLENNLLVKPSETYQVGVYAKTYIAGDLTNDLLKQDAVYDLNKNVYIQKRKHYYESHGINFDSTHLCKCCNKVKPVRNFIVFTEENVLSPVCGICYKERTNEAKKHISDFKQDLRESYLNDKDEIDTLIEKELSNDWRYKTYE